MSWGRAVGLVGRVVVCVMAAGVGMNVHANYATGLADLRMTGHPQAAAANGSAMVPTRGRPRKGNVMTETASSPGTW